MEHTHRWTYESVHVMLNGERALKLLKRCTLCGKTQEMGYSFS